jgi:hypothetical protein
MKSSKRKLKMLKIILDWLKKNLAFILGAVFLFCMVACFVSGCRYHKFRHPCPEAVINTHTVIIHDTIIHEITDTFPYYVQKVDSIVYRDTIILEVDTALILKDYFALHYYTRNWQDSLLQVDLKDVVSENKFIENDFRYKILRPQAIINNTIDQSIHYAKYIYLGIDVPVQNLNYIEVEGLFAFRKGYFGLGYEPQIKSVNIKGGVTLFKFK